MLFERAQAEYWIGFAAHERGDRTACREWFTRYRDSAIALATLEHDSARAREEVSYGYHNLAALDLDAGDLAAARKGFLLERSIIISLIGYSPSASSLRYRLADVSSWLGTVAERSGDFAEAATRYAEMAAGLEFLAKNEPEVARWKKRQAESVYFVGLMHSLRGEGTAAAAEFAAAQVPLQKLTAQDPENADWAFALLRIQLYDVMLDSCRSDPAALIDRVIHLRERLEMLVTREPQSRLFSRNLEVAWRLEGALLFRARASGARAAAVKAVELGEEVVRQAPEDSWASAELAQSHLCAGRITADEGHRASAEDHWRRALAVLNPFLKNSADWRFLDPAAQALTLLSRKDEARPYIDQLREFHYHALDPLAAPILDVVQFPANSTKEP